MPEDGIEQLRPFDAIFLGAVGFPGVPDHVSLWGLLIPIRREFDQYVNIRPVWLMPGRACPLAGRKPGDIDMMSCGRTPRANTARSGGREFEGTERRGGDPGERVHRKGVDRILRYAFEQAMKRRAKHVTSATKSNGIAITMPYWDERFRGDGGAVSGGAHRPVPHRHPDRAVRAQPAVVRRGGGLQPVRRHPLGPGPGLRRHHRHRPVGQPEPRAASTRPCSSRCTARRRTSPARASPTPSARSGRVR